MAFSPNARWAPAESLIRLAEDPLYPVGVRATALELLAASEELAEVQRNLKAL